MMKDVNSLVRLPELTGTMRELSMELVRAGVIEEMVADSLPDEDVLEDDDEAEAEVDKALREVIGGGLESVGATPTQPEKMEDDYEEDQETLEDMRERLEMLKS